jgi:hypothetical protein
MQGVDNLLGLTGQFAPFAFGVHGEFGQLNGWHSNICEGCYWHM